MSDDVRSQQLNHWLDFCLPELFAAEGWGEVPPAELTPASSDASFRHYSCWQGGDRNPMVMDAPPSQEDYQPSVKVAGLLAGADVHVSGILAQDLENGPLLLSNLGRRTYLDVLHPGDADKLFEPALGVLIAFQRVGVAGALPVYDEAALRRELQPFSDWYLARHLGVKLGGGALARWQRICDPLVRDALERPRALVHRDYMPRSLMLSKPNPDVLDLQDALHGPVTYDVTCLYKDVFVNWPKPCVYAALSRYWKRATWADIPLSLSFEGFLHASGLMGVQRHLKAIGTFARICHRDGKPRYLGDTPRFFRYLETAVARRPELTKLSKLLVSLLRGAEV